MGLSINLIEPKAIYKVEPLYECNITHNLGTMAQNADIYEALWRPYRLHKDYVKSILYNVENEFEASVTVV